MLLNNSVPVSLYTALKLDLLFLNYVQLNSVALYCLFDLSWTQEVLEIRYSLKMRLHVCGLNYVCGR